MKREMVLKEINEVCKSVFSQPNLKVGFTTNANDIGNWDSMTNLFLIDSIEKKYQIKFSLNEILNARNIGDLCDIVIKKSN